MFIILKIYVQCLRYKAKCNFYKHLVSPPPYMTASMMEEIQDTWLLVALKITSISLKNTVMDFAKA